MEQTYLCKFDTEGHRQETYLACEYTEEQKQEMIANGFVEITQEDWEYYVGNKGMGDNGTGYIRDPKTGKPISAPAHVPTKDELLSQLENEYTVDKAELMKYYTEASLTDDTEVMAELKDELTELEADYEARRKEIEEG